MLWLANKLISYQQSCPKTVVYSHSIITVANIYSYLMAQLGDRAFRGGVVDPQQCLLSMYHAHIAEPLRKHTLSEFGKPDSVIRVVVCTIAFGMG